MFPSSFLLFVQFLVKFVSSLLLPPLVCSVINFLIQHKEGLIIVKQHERWWDEMHWEKRGGNEMLMTWNNSNQKKKYQKKRDPREVQGAIQTSFLEYLFMLMFEQGFLSFYSLLYIHFILFPSRAPSLIIINCFISVMISIITKGCVKKWELEMMREFSGRERKDKAS